MDKPLTETFSNLSAEFGPVPWWCWTGHITKAGIKKQLDAMHKKGVNEFFLMALYGLSFPSFLQESYWEYVEFVLEHCRKKGMKAWFYDDLNWPSGTAAGYFVKDYPEYRSAPLELVETTVLPGDSVNIASAANQNMPVFTGTRNPGGAVIPVKTDPLKWWKDEKSRFWTNNSGKPVKLVILVRVPYPKIMLSSSGTADSWNQHGYGDLLNRDAVEKWMSFIYGEYEKRFKNLFGTTIKGFFFDEPYANISKNPGFAWTDNFASVFEKRYGYKLENRFHLLLSEDGKPESVKTRIDYYSLMSQMFSESFAKTAAKWCEKNNLEITGHCMAEETVSLSGKVNGDIHEFMKHIQVPGMDMLAGCMPGTPLETKIGKRPYDYPLLMYTAKKITGTARYSGAKRTMCEAFGVRDWNCSLAQQKKDTDWLVSMGISLINDNALIYTISDFRKRAISGKHFSQPWWKHYRFYADYCRRASLFAAHAPLDTDTAVLYSATSANASITFRLGLEASFWNETEESDFMLEMLTTAMNSLFSRHLDFEMVFEDVVNEASVSKGTLKCKNAVFRTVIVPGCYVIDKNCAKQLEKFSDSGGKVVWLGRLPLWTYDSKQLKPFRPGKNQKIIDGNAKGSKNKDIIKEFEREVAEKISRRWSIEYKGKKDGIWATARETKKSYSIFLANHSGEDREIAVKYRVEGVPEILDVENGKIYKAMEEKRDENKVELALLDGQSLILSINKGAEKDSGAGTVSRKTVRNKKFVFPDRWQFTTKEDNSFLPRLFVKTDPCVKGEKENWEKSPLDETWKKVENGKLFDGFTAEESPFYWVRGYFNLGFKPEKLSFIADTAHWKKLFVNGKDTGKSKACELWDAQNRSFDAEVVCKEGENEFTFLVQSYQWRSWQRELAGFMQKDFIEPVVISGRFAVKEDKGISRIVLPEEEISSKGWTSEGYPHFAGTGIYRQKFFLEETPVKPQLVLSSVSGVASVSVNGKKAGTRAWKPYRFDLDGLVKKGHNTLEISVTNGLGNILRRVYGGGLGIHAESGITGRIFILYGK